MNIFRCFLGKIISIFWSYRLFVARLLPLANFGGFRFFTGNYSFGIIVIFTKFSTSNISDKSISDSITSYFSYFFIENLNKLFLLLIIQILLNCASEKFLPQKIHIITRTHAYKLSHAPKKEDNKLFIC